ncbi:PucR family transcriptional regulator ligand-binding domain-containing protein [Rhodococcus pseudokoreensis]|uniref:PucR family transcriptional regulator ligand-binding domain-containing protein n=1 Tax=Rhodococcus pseudokoreensis TaxID=2811421 RepID=A0A974W4A5_9NOCA|nr:PucR family transcriptional regulator [Rhodococcus pseudokoreensis]QSE90739.1 PucR family transcriptional regulator ligand-binding domain-containing protein [Rhodococcus pseudokoreensis]
MAMRLNDVLEHPLVAAGHPVLVSGADRLGTDVRWIHCADLYDIAPLLRGEEVLLTNGVGLVGVDEEALRNYVRQLAQKGIAGLMIEVGRTFDALPPEMADEAETLGLPLIVLQPALRFTEVAEAINSMIIDRSITKLRHADEISRSLSELLARGGTLAAIVDGIRDICGTWVSLQDDSKQIIAHAGSLPPGLMDTSAATAAVFVDGIVWGQLTVGSTDVPSVLLDALLDRAPAVIALALIRNEPNVTRSLRLKHMLIEQLLQGRYIEDHVLQDRLRAAGLPTSVRPYACVVIDRLQVPNSVDVLNQLIETHGYGLVGVYEGLACAVIAAHSDETTRGFSTTLRDDLTSRITFRGKAVAAVGPCIIRFTDLPRSMTEAHLSLTICQDVNPASVAVVAAKDMAVERLLYKNADRAELRLSVEEMLGQLIAYDQDRQTKLMPTLTVLLECGGSKALAAQRLHLRRQSLYYRLNQLSSLLEYDLDNPRDRTALSVAVSAMRIVQSPEHVDGEMN